jgi:hypothetical protein
MNAPSGRYMWLIGIAAVITAITGLMALFYRPGNNEVIIPPEPGLTFTPGVVTQTPTPEPPEQSEIETVVKRVFEKYLTVTLDTFRSPLTHASRSWGKPQTLADSLTLRYRS